MAGGGSETGVMAGARSAGGAVAPSETAEILVGGGRERSGSA